MTFSFFSLMILSTFGPDFIGSVGGGGGRGSGCGGW